MRLKSCLDRAHVHFLALENLYCQYRNRRIQVFIRMCGFTIIVYTRFTFRRNESIRGITRIVHLRVYIVLLQKFD